MTTKARQELIETARIAVELNHRERYGEDFGVNMQWLEAQSDEQLKALIERIYRG